MITKYYEHIFLPGKPSHVFKNLVKANRKSFVSKTKWLYRENLVNSSMLNFTLRFMRGSLHGTFLGGSNLMQMYGIMFRNFP